MRLEKSNIPANLKSKYNTRFRNLEHDLDGAKRKLQSYASDRSKLFGDRYSDNPDGSGAGDAQLEQRQQLLSGTDRLQRSSGRLTAAQRMALETEQIGASTLSDLHRQREQIEHTRITILDSESYTDRSIKTLKGMARRCVSLFLNPILPYPLSCATHSLVRRYRDVPDAELVLTPLGRLPRPDSGDASKPYLLCMVQNSQTIRPLRRNPIYPFIFTNDPLGWQPTASSPSPSSRC